MWLTVLSRRCPALSQVAGRYLAMHATSCAAERNLSVFGRIYDKYRSKLRLERAEKVVFLAANACVEKGRMVPDEEELVPFLDELEGVPTPEMVDTVDIVEDDVDDGVDAVVDYGLPVAPQFTPGDEAFMPDPNDKRTRYFYNN